MSRGRSSAAGITASTEPTFTARSMECTASNSAGHLGELLRAHRGPQLGELGPQPRPLDLLGGRELGLDRTHPRVGRSPVVDLAGEDDPGRRRTADDRGERALDGEHGHVVVQRLGEHDERAAVVAGDDAEDDRAVEVHHGAADLGAVLELEHPHRLRRAVEARQVREDDEGPAAARGVHRAGGLLRRAREQRARRPGVRAVARREAAARDRPGLDAQQAHRVTAEVGVEDDRGLGVRHPGPALERRVVGVGHRAHQRADVERLLALRVPRRREDVPDGGEVAVRHRVRVVEDARGRAGRTSAPGAGTRSPGTTYACS